MAEPLSASQALAALRAEGCRVEQYRSWRTHNRGNRGTGWGPLNGVMIHHTVTSGTMPTVRICYDGYAALPGPLCHGVIGKDGVVYLVGWGRANHAGLGDDNVLDAVIDEDGSLPAPNERNTDGNSRFYGFECENLGDGNDPWPDAQLDAIERAAAALCRAHGWSAESVIGHAEWSYTKIDPRGFSMEGMRRRIADRLDQGPQQQEDDMPSAKEIADAVWNTDNVLAVPGEWGAPGNEYWEAGSVLRDMGKRARRIESKVEAGNLAIAEMAKALGARDEAVDVDALVARIEAAIASITVELNVPEGN